MVLNNRFNTKKPIIDELIDECDMGEFKLTDAAFAQACSEYGMTEESVMELMVNCDKGEFIRLSDGWLFKSK